MRRKPSMCKVLPVGISALIALGTFSVSAQNAPAATDAMAPAAAMGGGQTTGPLTPCPGAISKTRPYTEVFKTEFTTLKGQEQNGGFGESVASGDFDRDGYTDIAVGATGEEKVYVYRGTKDGLASTPSAVLKGEKEKSEFGRSMTVGDINGDGYADVIVGAHSFEGALGSHQGKLYVFLGGSKGVSDKPAQSIEGEHKGDEYARTFAVFDMDGDGINDLLTGASGYNGDQTYQGKVYVYRGTKAGLDTKPWFSAVGEHSDDEFARAVTAADLNHDGHMDLIVGQPGLTGGGRQAGVTIPGTMHVFYGSAKGLSPTANFKAPGEMIKGHLGEGLSGVGDVNHDGYDDVAIGARDFSCGDGAPGKLYLYLGGAKGLSMDRVWALPGKGGAGVGRTMAPAGDLDADGFADFLSAAPMGTAERGAGVYIFFGGATTWGKEPIVITSDEASSGIGFGVFSAGDINKDGAPDIVIGAPTGGGRQGWVRVYYGKIASLNKPAAAK